jgi:hypothetical protein
MEKVYMRCKLTKTVEIISRIHATDLDIHKSILDVEQRYFEKFNKDIRDNSELVEYAVKVLPISWFSLAKYLSESYRDNQDIMLYLIKSQPHNYQYVSQKLRSCKTFTMKALEVIKCDAEYIYRNTDVSLKQDKDIILLANSKGNIIIEHKISRELALEIVSAGVSLQRVKQYSDDREIVLLAVTNNGSDFQFASDSLKRDEEIIRIALQSSPTMINKLSPKDKLNQEYCKIAAIHDGSFANCISYTLLFNRSFMHEVLKLCKKNILDIVPLIHADIKKE